MHGAGRIRHHKQQRPHDSLPPHTTAITHCQQRQQLQQPKTTMKTIRSSPIQTSSAQLTTSSNETATAIEEAFRALDTTFSGSISIDDVLTLFLGMGYQPETMTVEELRSRSGDKETLTLSEIQRLLRQVCSLLVQGHISCVVSVVLYQSVCHWSLTFDT